MKVTWVLNEGCICTALLLPTQLLNIIEMNKGLQIRKLIMWINFLVLVHILYPFFESLCWSTDSSKSKKEHLQKRVKVKYTEQIRNATDNIYNIIAMLSIIFYDFSFNWTFLFLKLVKLLKLVIKYPDRLLYLHNKYIVNCGYSLCINNG